MTEFRGTVTPVTLKNCPDHELVGAYNIGQAMQRGVECPPHVRNRFVNNVMSWLAAELAARIADDPGLANLVAKPPTGSGRE